MAIYLSLLVSIIILSNVVERYKYVARSNFTIETIHGDLYDCVDIYKQPTLLHSTLGSERIKMTIAKKLERQKLKAMEPKRGNKSDGFKAEEYWLNKEGCPVGTMPIRKMTKKQLQRDLDASMSLGNQYFGYNWIDVLKNAS
ncbi:hypothetical protein KY289_030585 [Solanum tuberosum]|nr:hypothetical protein KY289_030585 [Solanum tuberosum]